MQKLLFEVIMTKQCNKKCNYCDLNFENKKISKEVIDDFYKQYIDYYDKIESFYVNFFGGEPMLNYDLIKYFLKKFQNNKIRYSIGTNGDLLNQESLKFLLLNNVEINLSIDSENINNKKLFNLIENYKEIININFIIEPKKINYLLNIDLGIIKKFKNINIMPIYTSLKRKEKDINDFYEILKYFKTYFINNSLTYFQYYKGQTSEKQFILDAGGEIYQDVDTLLWIQKQFNNVPESLGNIINKNTYLGNISETSFEKIVSSYSIESIEKLILIIPKITNNFKNNYKLNKLYSLVFGK